MKMKMVVLSFLLFNLLFYHGIIDNVCFSKSTDETSKFNYISTVADIIIPDDYSTIQKGIDNANAGDIILVKSGVYVENNIIIEKTINLIGENKNTTTIRGDGSHTILIVYADEVVISGFHIENGGNMMDANIALMADNCIISNNIINKSNDMGIALYHSSGNTIEGNMITKCETSALRLIEKNYNNLIANNTIKQNIGVAIFCNNSNNNEFLGNTIISNFDGIMVYDSIGNKILRNQISDCNAGIYLYQSIDQQIKLNLVSQCPKGIYLEECNENQVKRNILSDNEEGIFASYAKNNIIIENNFLSNVHHSRFTMWLSPQGLQKNKWNRNYWDDSLGILPKIISGILFIPTDDPIGIFFPWFSIDWNPTRNPYDI